MVRQACPEFFEGLTTNGRLDQSFQKYMNPIFLFLLVSLCIACDANAETVPRFKDCPQCPEMVVIPAGGFQMGAQGSGEDALPVHHVKINSAFALATTEVTQGQWKWIMGNNPSFFLNCGDDCPVEKVSWDVVHEFIQQLNARTGQQYRLPSEAEWEYACRAGEDTLYCGGSDAESVAWFNRNASRKTHPVAGKQANAWGLYDMSGNVWEWVEDGHHDTYDGAPAEGSAWGSDKRQRVVRGGAWGYAVNVLRVSNRGRQDRVTAAINTGFRLARVLQGKP
jgi:formylglycine-generating enzyme required for sulfatase activity